MLTVPERLAADADAVVAERGAEDSLDVLGFRVMQRGWGRRAAYVAARAAMCRAAPTTRAEADR